MLNDGTKEAHSLIPVPRVSRREKNKIKSQIGRIKRSECSSASSMRKEESQSSIYVCPFKFSLEDFKSFDSVLKLNSLLKKSKYMSKDTNLTAILQKILCFYYFNDFNDSLKRDKVKAKKQKVKAKNWN